MIHIGSEFEFENKYNEITLGETEVLKFVARSPGDWGNSIEIAIANPEDFGTNTSAFPGIDLDSLFEYFPDEENHEIGVVIKDGSSIKEIYLVSLNKDSRDSNNKSNYIENVINRQSDLVFVKYVGDKDLGVASQIGSDALKLNGGITEEISNDDILEAYELWDNKEEVDIDIVIGNEVDDGDAAFRLADSRKDCIAFLGTHYAIVGLKAAQAVNKVIEHRGDRNSMFSVYSGNYKYQYDKLSVA